MRAQAHTLEATVAALLMLSSLIFALQMTAVTPLSASTSSQHIENQQQATGEGVLAAAASQGALKPAVLYWNNDTERYHGTTEALPEYTAGPPNQFGAMLNRSFGDRGIAYNVYFRFNGDGSRGAVDNSSIDTYVYNGVPSDNAVSSTYTVTLTDNDTLYDEDGEPTGTELHNSTHTIPDDDTDDPNLYNVVRVEVVAWRI